LSWNSPANSANTGQSVTDIAIILPAFNEESTVAATIEAFWRNCRGRGSSSSQQFDGFHGRHRA